MLGRYVAVLPFAVPRLRLWYRRALARGAGAPWLSVAARALPVNEAAMLGAALPPSVLRSCVVVQSILVEALRSLKMLPNSLCNVL